jgi:WD40 repeat protein
MLIAARDEGSIGGSAAALLAAHLRECADCAAVAGSVVPTDGARAIALPAVPPSAYAIGREVARGGMGRILAADDLRIGRPVAVKELLGKSPALAARFEREARVTARLQHPGIVPIYEIGAWPDGTPFYAMRMIEGSTLREALKDRAALDERLALLPAVIAAAEAVAFAHDKRVIHRDLTPNNILVGAHGDTVVIDWGLAKDLSDAREDAAPAGPYRDQPSGEGLTRAGAVIGTAAYMPPEQARGESVDERADVYALGAILYHLLANAPPYRATKSDELLALVQAAPPSPVASIARGAPRDLTSIVDKAMSREPNARYANAGELAAELRRFQTGQVVAAHHYSYGERARRWMRSHRGLVIGTSVAFAAILITGSIALRSILGERDRADTQRERADEQRALAEQTNAELLEEQGRQELLAGNPTRAAVWLSAAYSAGDRNRSLRFLLGSAMRDVETPRQLLECGASVHTLTLSPDKSTLLAACGHMVRLWRLSDGVQLRAFSSGTGNWTKAKYSRDGTSIAAYGTDGVARIYDAATGELRQELPGHGDRITNVDWSHDGRTLLTSSFDRKVRLWDSVTGKLVRTIDAASPTEIGVRGGSIGDDLLWSRDRTDLKIWDARTGALLRTMQTFRDDAVPVGGDLDRRDPDRLLVMCGIDRTVKLWDAGTGELVRAFSGHTDAVMVCELSADRKTLVTASHDGTAKVWDTSSGKVLQSVSPGGLVGSAKLSADGTMLVTAGPGSGVRVWDVATGALLGADDTGDSDQDDVVFERDRIVVSWGVNLTMYRGLGMRRIRSFHAPIGTMIAATSAEGTRAVTVAGESLEIWDVDSGRRIPHEVLREPHDASGNLLAARVADGVAIVDMRTGDRKATVPVNGIDDLDLDALDVSEDGRFLIVKHKQGRAAAWDVSRGVEIVHWEPGDFPTGIATGGDRVVVWKATTTDPHAEVWSLSPPRLEQRIDINVPGGNAWFDRARARVVLSAANEDLTTVWDLTSNRRLRSLPGTGFPRLDATRTILAVVAPGAQPHVELVRLSDGKTITTIPLELIAGFADVAPNGDWVAASAPIGSHAQVWDGVGRLVSVIPHARMGTFGRDTFQLKLGRVDFSRDGARLLAWDDHKVVVVPIVVEERSADDIAQIVRERSPWRVGRGRLEPLAPQVATLRGRVSRHGAAVANAKIIVRNSGISTRDVTDAAGRYELRDLPVGNLEVLAIGEAIGAVSRFHRITLASGDNTADFDLEFDASIAGRVFDVGGQPLAGLHVSVECVSCVDEDTEDDTTRPDGSFELKFLLGSSDYKLRVSRDPEGRHVLEQRAGQSPIHVKDGNDHVTGLRVEVIAP